MCAVDDPQLQEILTKHTEAMGGLYNWSQIESIRLSGTIERDGKVVNFVIIKKRPNQIRTTITLPIPGKENEFFQIIRAHDGKRAWTATRRTCGQKINKIELDQQAAETLLADASILPKLIGMWQDGAEIVLLTPKGINGTATYTIQARTKDSNRTFTFQLSRETYRTLQYRENKTSESTITHMEDYHRYKGVYVPTRSTIVATRYSHSVITTKSIEVGVGIYKEYFENDSQTVTANL
jgi:hypothetical protein